MFTDSERDIEITFIESSMKVLVEDNQISDDVLGVVKKGKKRKENSFLREELISVITSDG
jgi:hypothetical protein